MPHVANIISQLNKLRNGDFRHYVGRTTAPLMPVGGPWGGYNQQWQALLAYWKLNGGVDPDNTIDITEQTTYGDDEPHRYVTLSAGEYISQELISRDFYSKPSVREANGSINAVTGLGAAQTIRITTSPDQTWIVEEPYPAPLGPISVSAKVGDTVQVVNRTNPTGSGLYLITSVASTSGVILTPKAPFVPVGNTILDDVTVIRTLGVYLLDFTLTYVVRNGVNPDHLFPTISIYRNNPAASVVLTPKAIVSGGLTFDSYPIPGGNWKQVVVRFRTELVRPPVSAELKILILRGTHDIADVALVYGDYHLSIDTAVLPAAGNIPLPLVFGSDHMHWLTGRGDLVLLAAGNTSPPGYKKLVEELAIQTVQFGYPSGNANALVSYDSFRNLSTITIVSSSGVLQGWQVGSADLSATYELVFVDEGLTGPVAPLMHASLRMHDVVFAVNVTKGGAMIKINGSLDTETVVIAGSTFTRDNTSPAAFPALAWDSEISLISKINAQFAGLLLAQVVVSGPDTFVVVTTVSDGWTDTTLGVSYPISDTLTSGPWSKTDGGALSPTLQLNVIGGSGATFTVHGDLSLRNNTNCKAYIVATAPLINNSTAKAGVLVKPSKFGNNAQYVSATVLEIDISGVAVNDILTFIDAEGDPMPEASSYNGPVYRILAVDVDENQITIKSVGGTTDVSAYVTGVENHFVIEKSSATHTHYASQANVDERSCEDGGARNTAYGDHGHKFPLDDAIPPYRKFIICEKL